MHHDNHSSLLKIILDNLILSAILTIRVIIKGTLPFLNEFETGVSTRNVNMMLTHGFTLIGGTIGLVVSIVSLFIALSPIIIPLALAYTLLNNSTAYKIRYTLLNQAL